MTPRPAIAALAAATVLFVSLLGARPAAAHPAGFTSVNRYVGVQCDARGALHIAYLLDFAELPSYSEFDQLDADHDGTVTPDEQRAYLDRRVPPLLASWVVTVNGERATVRTTGASLEVREGERGMSTLRIAADVVAETPGPSDARELETFEVTVRDPAFADRSGWREMAADDSTDTVLTAGARERQSEALAYGSSAGGNGNATVNPPRVDQAAFTFRRAPAGATVARRAPPEPPVTADPALVRLSAAMKRASGSASFSLVAALLALALGAGHALSPGHGKALAAAYLVGRRARPSQALALGLAVTAAHTAAVFAIGLFAVGIERVAGTDRVLRGLELASAVAVTALGIVQLSARWREVTGDAADHGHRHDPVHPSGGLRAVVLLGASSGLTPCPSALAILLGAIALHRYAFGLALVAVFSLGVAATLTAVGLLVLLARRLVQRVSTGAPFVRWLPVLSSACVTAIGVLLCVSAWSPSGR